MRGNTLVDTLAPPDDVITKEAAAARLGITLRELERRTADGTYTKIRQRGRVYYRLSEIDQPEAREVVKAAPQAATMTLLAQAFAGAMRDTRPELPRAPRQWLSLEEAEEYSGLPPSLLEKLRRDRQLVAVGRGDQRRYQRASIDTFSGRIFDGERKDRP